MREKALFHFLFISLLVLSAVSCGKKEERQIGVDGYVYVVQNPDFTGGVTVNRLESDAGQEDTADAEGAGEDQNSRTEESAVGAAAGNARPNQGLYSQLASILGRDGKNYIVSGNSLYFLRSKSGETQILRVDLPEGDFEEDKSGEDKSLTVQRICSAAVVDSYTVDPEGNVYYYAQAPVSYAFTQGSLETRSGKGGTVYKVDSSGKEVFSVRLKEASAFGALVTSHKWDHLAVDQEGLVYLLCGDQIFLLDGDGTSRGTISLKDHTDSGGETGFLWRNEKGRVCCRLDNGEIVELHPGQEPPVSSVNALKGVDGNLYITQEGILSQSGDQLYSYSLDEEGNLNRKPVLRWQDSGLADRNVWDLVLLPGGALLVRYDENSRQGGQNLILKKTSLKELPQREVIVFASLSHYNDLTDAVLSFNVANDRYQVSLEYFETDSSGAGSLDAASARLDARMVSSDPPDLLNLTDLDIGKYARKGSLADLKALLREETVSQYFENMLEDYTLDGRLVCIPKHFALSTVAGRKGTVDSLAGGYDSRELMDLLQEWFAGSAASLGTVYDNGVNTPVVAEKNRTYYLETFLVREYLTHYIDWETGDCHLGSREFGELLKWIKESAPEEEYRYMGIIEDFDYVPKGTLLVQQELSDFSDLLKLRYRLGEEPVLVGYPTVEKRVRHIARALDSVGIVEASSHKEGAAAFLEYYLSQEKKGDSYSFPTRRPDLEEMAKEAVTPYYVLDSEGNRQLMSDGVTYNTRSKGYVNVARDSYEFDLVDQSLVDMMVEAIEEADFTPRLGVETEILGIIREEASLYFEDRKPLEEVLEIIENRVGNVVREGL